MIPKKLKSIFFIFLQQYLFSNKKRIIGLGISIIYIFLHFFFCGILLKTQEGVVKGGNYNMGVRYPTIAVSTRTFRPCCALSGFVLLKMRPAISAGFFGVGLAALAGVARFGFFERVRSRSE